MPAYPKTYLEDAAENLGDMFDYAVTDCGRNPDAFFEQFIASGIARQFGKGHPKYVAGMSGVELARQVIHETEGTWACPPNIYRFDRNEFYWAGWALAQYQWHSGLQFEELYRRGLTVSRVISMYSLHEADITKFIQTADHILASKE